MLDRMTPGPDAGSPGASRTGLESNHRMKNRRTKTEPRGEAQAGSGTTADRHRAGTPQSASHRSALTGSTGVPRCLYLK
jgi:hypothetical protein